MNAAVIAWMASIQGLIAAAPDVIAFAAKVKGWIADMFSAGLINSDEQTALNNRVTVIVTAVLNGNMPAHWVIEPDPS